MYFDEIDLNDNVLDALYDMHFEQCTPIQEKCIPEILKGKDILGVAQTGTGKTAAYLLPILSKLADGGYPDNAINCVIMSPTRELAQQIDQGMQGFSYYLDGVSSVAVYGGNDGNRYNQELKSLSLGADVVIATPGRFISHISLGNVDLSKVSFFVLDEADRMLDMGFSEDILTIAKKLPKTCQTIMFSATMPDKIEQLAKTLLKNPVEIKLAVSKPAEKIHQMAYVCYETQKMGIIKDLFKESNLNRVIVFSGSKQKVKQIAGALQRMHINCGEMHSDLEQAERDEMMFQFKSGKIDVIVATDILSRGIDIDDITMVINYDVPKDVEDYVHRIGRTARANRDGKAITLVSEQDIYYFQQIEKFLEKEIEKISLPEGLGEAPEYKQTNKPGRVQKAKDRRRRDRNQQSHKDKKEKIKRGGERRQEKQTKAADTNSEGNVHNNEAASSVKKRRTPNNKKRTNDAVANKVQSQKSGNETSAENKQPKNKDRKRNNKPIDKAKVETKSKKDSSSVNQSRRRKNRRPSDNKTSNAPIHSSKYAIREDSPVPTNKENKLKQLVKKPLNWLKSLSKH